MPQIHKNPKWLVGEFQKSGEFDRLRKQLQTHFLNSDEVHPLVARVEEIAREKLSSDEHLEHKTREAVFSEVLQDMERYPIVERAVHNLAVDKDDALVSSIEEYLRNIVQGKSNEAAKLWNAHIRQQKRRVSQAILSFTNINARNEGDDNDDSSDYSEDDTPGDDELQLIITGAGEGQGVPSTKRLEDETISNATAHLPVLNQNTSGDATPRQSPLYQHSGSQPAPSSLQTETDVKSQFTHSTSSQGQALPDFPSVEAPSAKDSRGDLLNNEDPVGGSAAQAIEVEQARAAQAEREQRSQDMSYLQRQANANNSYTTEALATFAPHRCYDQSIQRSDVTSAIGGVGLSTMSIPSETPSEAPPAASQLDSHGPISSRPSSMSATPVHSLGRPHTPIMPSRAM